MKKRRQTNSHNMHEKAESQRGQSQTNTHPADVHEQHVAEYAPAYGFKILELAAEGHIPPKAAMRMGLDPETVNNWAKQHPEFAEAIERAECLCAFYHESMLLFAPDEASIKAAMPVLERVGAQEAAREEQSRALKDFARDFADDFKKRVS